MLVGVVQKRCRGFAPQIRRAKDVHSPPVDPGVARIVGHVAFARVVCGGTAFFGVEFGSCGPIPHQGNILKTTGADRLRDVAERSDVARGRVSVP